MNYRHGYHAGNFADIAKHLALVTVLRHLRRKDAPFAVIDTHAGRGLYDLAAAEARKTGEAENGIARLVGLTEPLPDVLTDYLAIAARHGAGRYPGSPLIAASLLRPQDRLVAIEKHPEEAAALREVLAPWRKAQVEEADGHARLAKLLPPPERRGIVLIDPPFEDADEFTRLAATLRAAHRRFATGIFLVWYPVKSQAEADAFIGEALAGGGRGLTIDIAVDATPGKLARAGLLVVNPPYGFDEQMRECLALVTPRLPGGQAWLAVKGD